MANNAKLTDPNMLIQAGIDPRTGLPLALSDKTLSCVSKGDIKKQLRIIDEQTAINRYTWYNLPEGLDGRLMERILYYRGQAMAFFLQDKFYFLPYSLDGTIDVYGRFLGVTPLPFNGTANDGGKGKDKPWIQGLTFKPVYDPILPEDFMDKSPEELKDFIETSCVILKDYTEQYSQTNIARQIINDPILDIMSECFPFMRTALLNGTGVMGMKVSTEAESSSVHVASSAINKAALEGKKYVPIVGNVDFQELTGGNVAKAEEFLLAMQSLDNYRLSTYGLDNGGLFQKKSHVLEAEQEMNTGNVGLINRDGLQNRQDFCDIFNSIFGTSVWCEVSEVVIGVDTTGDGVLGDNESNQKEVISDDSDM